MTVRWTPPRCSRETHGLRQITLRQKGCPGAAALRAGRSTTVLSTPSMNSAVARKLLREPFVLCGICEMHEHLERTMTLAIAEDADDRLRSLVRSARENNEPVDPTLLIVATMAGARKCMLALLESGVDVNTQDAEGRTALFWAITMNGIEIVRILLDAGADTELGNERGEDAMSQARLWRREEILDMLRQHRESEATQ